MKLNIALCILCIAAPLTAGAADTESCISWPLSPEEITGGAYENFTEINFECAGQSGSKVIFNQDRNLLYIFYDCACTPPLSEKKESIYLHTGCTKPAYEYVSGCECVCNNCDSTGWVSTGTTGYEKQTIRRCDCSGKIPQCNDDRTLYQCAKGYYGKTSDGKTGCSKCPANATCNGGYSKFSCNQGYYENGDGCTQCPTDPGGIQGTTNGTGATDISKCFIAKGTTSSNTKNGYHGQYKYVNDCHAQ